MSIRGKTNRILRGIRYSLNYLFLEYPRGLDFSIRNKSRGNHLSGSHGYALTSRPALQNMLSAIPYAGKAFLDIGSGKGGPVVFARQLGCSRSAGLEFEEHLNGVAQKNIAILGLEKVCSSIRVDAREFSNYSDYDIYFMFNPFDDDIYDAVVEAIVAQNRARSAGETKYLICYGGANISAVMRHECFKLLKQDICPYRLNSYRIFAMTAAS